MAGRDAIEARANAQKRQNQAFSWLDKCRRPEDPSERPGFCWREEEDPCRQQARAQGSVNGWSSRQGNKTAIETGTGLMAPGRDGSAIGDGTAGCAWGRQGSRKNELVLVGARGFWFQLLLTYVAKLTIDGQGGRRGAAPGVAFAARLLDGQLSIGSPRTNLAKAGAFAFGNADQLTYAEIAGLEPANQKRQDRYFSPALLSLRPLSRSLPLHVADEFPPTATCETTKTSPTLDGHLVSAAVAASLVTLMPPAPSRGNGGVSTSSASASVSLPSLPGAATAASTSPSPSPTSPPTFSPTADSQPPSIPAGASAAATTSTPSPTPTPTSTSPPASASASVSVSAASSSRPGLLARLGSSLNLPLPLRNRNRSVTDFHVRCDEPHRKYGAGDHVHGSVVLAIVKPVRITHLVVTLHGFVRVLRDPAGAAKVRNITTLPQGGSSSRPQYHGNGFASLFQDEQVLSGEGRLDPGRYEFGFDLVFPDKGLPSSIDFERGTVSYMVTATLTRPVSMAATMTCERKVMLTERIDVGLLPPPQPRTIFLEPISKKTRKKKSSMALDKGSAATPEAADAIPEPDNPQESVATPTTEDAATRENPPLSDQQSERRGAAPSSDVQSEISGESGRSISTAMSRGEFTQISQIGTSLMSAQQQAVNDKTITASIELLKGGCLPGDAVSVRVTVQHIKQVKSMTGVIVTLFRQGKIDTSPPSQLFKDMMTKEDARRIQREDIYPRSRTGLGGLSLSSAGSISVFRKDLDQTTAPLIIDPETMQASVTVPVKLPDDSFPTIKGVPGDMVSFKYQVEVIVDLGGRLSGHFPSRKSSRFGTFSSSATDQSISMFSQRRGAQIEIIDTSSLRRQKGIVCVTIESVVGTVDTSGARKLVKVSSSSKTLDNAESDDEINVLPTPTRYEEIDRDTPHSQGPPPQDYFPPQRPPYASPTPSHPSYPQPGNHDLAPSYVPPPPQLPDQNNLSEKDRIRQAEQRLLPSRPPVSPAGPAGPSSPDEDDIYDAQATPRPPYAGNSGEEDNMEPSAPTEEDFTTTTNIPTHAGEDKQELERRRLMQEASAPPEFPEDMDRRGDPGRAPREDEVTADAEPTAPVLDEDEDDYPGYGTNALPSGSTSATRRRDDHDGEQLPAYQR
ncbi:ph-response regulator palf rim8 [Trichoderma arundinaceum]|uniref:Ph-response regulator palf rim8 n=1 Tax=Trichoderma arundinaceum TaxID=490622 RepID=A0A395NGY1_TRIAR|nr:ph-response regulator palf rim8 [Trichoderma arundinaceum]